MIRLLDIVLSFIGLVFLLPIFLVIVLIGWVIKSPLLFFQVRVGHHQKHFTIVKFRTMKIDTPSLPTHLVDSSATNGLGHFLRRMKIDEFPQLWNVFIGEMSIVGPRPCLPNQIHLIRLRFDSGIFEVRPGITGLSQISGIDMSTPDLLVEMDLKMIRTLTTRAYLKYIFMTLTGKGCGDSLK
jgi:O-antigen biosynthesis protein WbqP